MTITLEDVKKSNGKPSELDKIVQLHKELADEIEEAKQHYEFFEDFAQLRCGENGEKLELFHKPTIRHMMHIRPLMSIFPRMDEIIQIIAFILFQPSSQVDKIFYREWIKERRVQDYDVNRIWALCSEWFDSYSASEEMAICEIVSHLMGWGKPQPELTDDEKKKKQSQPG